MRAEHINANVASWEQLSSFVRDFIVKFTDSKPADFRQFTAWQQSSLFIIQHCIEQGYHRYFRAGTSMRTLVISTLDHHGLDDEPRVMLKIESEKKIKLVYMPALYPREGDNMLEYDLALEDALPTLRRFLHHLWRMTCAEPVPEDLMLKPGTFQAPILKEEKKLESMWIELF